jgi:hypothetical protein
VGGSRIDFAAGELFEKPLQLGCIHRSASLVPGRVANSHPLASPVFLTFVDPSSNIIDCAVGGFGASFSRADTNQ